MRIELVKGNIFHYLCKNKNLIINNHCLQKQI